MNASARSEGSDVNSSYHRPVLLAPVRDFLLAAGPGVYVDATLGGAGHAEALLQGSPDIFLLGIDRDPEARESARARLAPFAERVRIVAATFAELRRVLDDNSDFVGDRPLRGVLMDLGVSSHQLDDPQRGFSFRADAPLDMRMDPTTGMTAAEWLASTDVVSLTRLLRINGEDRFAPGIARALLERRPTTTGELSETVESAVPPAARRRGHVATRVFQALRVVVNDEVDQLSEGLEAALDALDLEGRLVVISYHSGEDRAVKAVLREAQTGGCTCPYELGCVCGAVSRVTVPHSGAILADAREVADNPRARSARLRTAIKVAP